MDKHNNACNPIPFAACCAYFFASGGLLYLFGYFAYCALGRPGFDERQSYGFYGEKGPKP